MIGKVVVTGGTGFLGQWVGKELSKREKLYELWGQSEGDLNIPVKTNNLFMASRPKVVYHLAAMCGGIGANRRQPAVFWRDNLMMGLNVLDACLASGVERLVLVGTTCSYPENCPAPFKEESMFDGYPEPTNAPYGIAKRSLIVGALAYQKQFGLDVVVVVPTNLYGPGDNFDPDNSHVIPAMLRKFREAKATKHSPVELWGSGKATRDFLYVEDAARGIVEAGEKAPSGVIINLGSGEEVSIKALASMIGGVVGYAGAIKWNLDHPDGQPRRALDITKAKRYMSWSPKVDLADGLAKTYTWYLGKQEVKKP